MSEPGGDGSPGSLRDRLGDHFGPAVVAGLVAISMLAALAIAILGPIRGPALSDVAATTAVPGQTTVAGATSTPVATIPELPPLDDFERPDGPLGTAPSGAAWTSLADAFEIRGARACADAVQGATATALVPAGSGGDVGVSARLATSADGAGLVVHYRDADNYIALLAVPKVAAWRFQVVQAGKVAFSENVPFTRAKDGVLITMLVSGGKAAIGADGKVTKVVEIPAGTDPAGGQAGLIAKTAPTTVCWDDFSMQASI